MHVSLSMHYLQACIGLTAGHIRRIRSSPRVGIHQGGDVDGRGVAHGVTTQSVALLPRGGVGDVTVSPLQPEAVSEIQRITVMELVEGHSRQLGRQGLHRQARRQAVEGARVEVVGWKYMYGEGEGKEGLEG